VDPNQPQEKEAAGETNEAVDEDAHGGSQHAGRQLLHLSDAEQQKRKNESHDTAQVKVSLSWIVQDKLRSRLPSRFPGAELRH
jgi:hypothetical protein